MLVCLRALVLHPEPYSMSSRSVFEKRRQRLHLGEYLRANGVESRPIEAISQRRGSKQRIQLIKVFRLFLHSVCFDATLRLLPTSLLLVDPFLLLATIPLLAI